MAGKQLGKFRQWAGEVISSKDKTTVTDEFRELEQDIERRKTGAQKLLLASKSYEHVLSKKKDNEALDDPEKLLPIDTLGVIQIVHGEEFGADSTYGSSLVKLGRAHCKIATLQEAYAVTFRDTYFASLETFVGEFKEYDQQKKKLESRRLALDAALTKVDKAKKDKEKHEAEDDLERAQQRYEECGEDLRAYMHAIQENEIDMHRELTNLLDIELNFARQYHEILEEVQSEWSRTSELVAKKPEGPMHTFSRSPKPSPKLPTRSPKLPPRKPSLKRNHSSASGQEVTLDSSDDEPERPMEPLRKRSDSGATAKSGKSGKSGKHSRANSVTAPDDNARKTVSDWMDSVRRKGKFASLQDDDAVEAPTTKESHKSSSSISSALGLSRKNSSKKATGSPLTSAKSERMMIPPSLKERRVVRALYPFEGAPDELSFEAGDEILVINEVLDDWWMGKLHGKQGLFPTSYTEVISTSSTKKPPIFKRNKSGKTTEENNFAAPRDSDDDSPDEGYRTSDIEEEDAFKNRPMDVNHSPFFGGEPKGVGLGLAGASQERIAPSLSRQTAPPPPVRRTSSADLTKKTPPPPPPRRTPTSTPKMPPRKLSNSSSSLLATQTDSARDISPFDSVSDLASIRCTDFKQNPFKPKGMCSNCFEYHDVQ
ncbi:BAR-domain-containing protein [Cylindrobasidium torrendii FP15055 ss-10]|uniref:BAR-domain-containing protein n=1 Tax=Cylindrobasidium torrendii FP15055 ss-10 TaxID=1314674 RepID=A0A0D7B647_9AGAR|nr:BAR-domain-containing protein [Cylindrobasidium torrendii FP15055 ss-10]